MIGERRRSDLTWDSAKEEFFPVRFHWNWSQLYIARRRIYLKQPPPAPTPDGQEDKGGHISIVKGCLYQRLALARPPGHRGIEVAR